MWRAATVLLVAACGCAVAVGAAPGRVPMTSVEAKLLEKNYGKPPLMVLKLELTLKNGDDEPRWFLVPRKLPAGNEKGVNGVEVRAFEGKGRAVVGRFIGTAGFHALLLPPKAEVTLR